LHSLPGREELPNYCQPFWKKKHSYSQIKSISTNAQYVTLHKYFSHPSFSD
jgi:hypothetical protein